MNKNERNYPAKGRLIKAVFVEGTTHLTKGRVYQAESDVVGQRVTITDDSGVPASYLASHFEWFELVPPEQSKHKRMTDEELRVLALNMIEGRVFTDWHIPSNQVVHMLPVIFLPLALMSREQHTDYIQDPPGMVYEDLSKAGSRSINGMPSFLSCRMVSRADVPRLRELGLQLQKQRDQFLGKSVPPAPPSA